MKNKTSCGSNVLLLSLLQSEALKTKLLTAHLLRRRHSFTKMKLKEDLNPMLLLLFHLTVWMFTFISFLPSYLLSWVSTANGDFFGSEEERAKRIKACSVLGPEGPYRAVSATKKLVTSLHPGVDTLDKTFEFAATRFPHRDCLGTREVISEEDEQQSNGKVFKKVKSSDIIDIKQQRKHIGVTRAGKLCFRVESGTFLLHTE